MQIVIDVPEAIYEEVMSGDWSNFAPYGFCKAIENGTTLPKCHGRLMILSEDKLEEHQINLNFSSQKWISEVGLSNATVTIIEADKTEREVE